MTGALVILAVTLAFGLLLFYYDQRSRRGSACGHDAAETAAHASSAPSDQQSAPSGNQEEAEGAPESEKKVKPRPAGCCGRHLVCEKLDSPYREKPVYFDDEELDLFAGRTEDDYTSEETEQFREVLMTLRPGEIREWLDSLAMRRISLPSALRDEALMLLEEQP